MVSIALAVFGGPHYYLWIRLVRDPALPAPWDLIATAALALLWLSPFAAMLLQRFVPTGIARALLWPAFVWLGVMFLLLVAFVAIDTVSVGTNLVIALTHGRWPSSPSHGPALARWLAGIACIAVSIAAIYAIYEARKPVRIRDLSVTLPRLPAALSGTTIVQISDIHVGPTLGPAFLQSVVESVNALSPDLVAITGDLIDDHPERFPAMLAPLAGLRARQGIFFVTGNHEYYNSGRGLDGAEAVIEILGRMGIRTLRNERVSIGDNGASFDLGGVYDYRAGSFGPEHRPNIEPVVAGRDPSRELVLLAHQPRFVRIAARHGVGLQLSGHTHGGQLWPFSVIVGIVETFLAGLYRFGDTQLYVSRGTGYWGPPMRLAAPSEITRIRLLAPTA